MRAARKRFGLIEFAERIGLSPAYWSRIERGHEKSPPDDIIDRVAGILDLSLDESILFKQTVYPTVGKIVTPPTARRASSLTCSSVPSVSPIRSGDLSD